MLVKPVQYSKNGEIVKLRTYFITSFIIINTARGNIINTQALYQALKNKKIAGACLDVLAEINLNNPLLELDLDTVIFTPHSAFCSQESHNNMADILVQNVRNFLIGTPTNIVN